MWNIVMGIIAIIAGLSGRVLIFTNSPALLIIIGVGILGLGIYQVAQKRRGMPPGE